MARETSAAKQLATGESDWQARYATLSAVDPATLSADDLDKLAEAAFWLGRPRESIAARQRAYTWWREAGDESRAARTAWMLFHNHFDLDEIAAARGWLARARGHADGLPESTEPGYVAIAEAELAMYNGDHDGSVAHSRRAVDVGRRVGDRDLEALGLASEGRALITRGDVRDGLDRLDAAMVGALSGELGGVATGWVYCLLLYSCQEVGDIRRATEWTDLAMRWCAERGLDSWYPGLCQLHRCEVQSLRGDWSEAEEGALQAAQQLSRFGDYLVADIQYLVGDIRLRRGDLAGAEDAFRAAHEHGREPQPGLALVQLARGDATAAATALQLALEDQPLTPARRGRLLAAHVQAELRLGHVDAATTSADELASLAERSHSTLLQAMADLARGSVHLGGGDGKEALRWLRRACATYRELSCPYEAAEARVVIGQALRRLGDEPTARLEFEAARTGFTALGAATDAARVAVLLDGVTRPHGLTAREAEVLRLVARGRSNRQIAEVLVISEHTVARHLSNIFTKLAVSSRAAAASFAYEHDLV